MNFDEKAKMWDKDPLKLERARIFAKEILGFLENKEVTNALEFGSGTGLVSFQLKERFRSITLADTSAGMMSVLMEKISNEKITTMKPFLVGGGNELNSLKGFDVIFTLLTLHHVMDINNAFSSFNTILNSGGLVFLGDLITEDGSFHRNDPEFDGHKGFEIEDINTTLRANGFVPLLDKIFYTIEREEDNIKKKFPLFLIVAKKI
jgi:ubiquinone/menaquinone biosynthesis C-methylase UbiE